VNPVSRPFALVGLTRIIDLMSVGSDTAAVTALTVQKSLADAWHNVDHNAQTHVMRTIEEAVDLVRTVDGDIQVLVTGSLHLVGGMLEVIDRKA